MLGKDKVDFVIDVFGEIIWFLNIWNFAEEQNNLMASINLLSKHTNEDKTKGS